MANSAYIQLVIAVVDALKEDKINSDVTETTVVSVVDRVIKAAWNNNDTLKSRFKTLDEFRTHVVKTRLKVSDGKVTSVTKVKNRYERDPVI